MVMAPAEFRVSVLLLTVSSALVACHSTPVESGVNVPAGATASSSSAATDAGRHVSLRERGGGDGTTDSTKALLATFSVERLAVAGQSRLVLVTHGSSSCPWRVTDVEVSRRTVVILTVRSRSGSSTRPCTMDDTPHHEMLTLPADVPATQVAAVRLTTADGVTHTERVTRGDRA